MQFIGAIAQGVGILADAGKDKIQQGQQGDKARAEAIDKIFQQRQSVTDAINESIKKQERQKKVLLIFGGVLLVSMIVIIAIKMKKK